MADVLRKAGLAARLMLLVQAVLSGAAGAQDLFGDVDDVLDGRRVLVDVVDLLAVEPKPNGDGSTTNPSRIVLETNDGQIVSQASTSDGTRNCEPSNLCINPFPQQERIVRLFDLPHEVKVKATVTAAASGTDCQGNGSQNLVLEVADLVAGTTTQHPFSGSAAFLQLAHGDFDDDGLDELILINSVEMFAITVQDKFDSSSALVLHTPTALPAAGYRALSQPSVGDVNGDGLREIIWAGGSESGAQYVYVATVCPTSVPNTVCDGAAPFEIIIDPLSFERVELAGTTCGGPAATAGNFMPATGDEVLAVYGNSGCNARARLLTFDGEMRATAVGAEIAVGSDTSTMLAETVRFDWFGETDQAVTVSEGLAVVGQNPIVFETRTVISVITFSSSGAMTAHQEMTLDGGTPRVRGLATGVFGPPPGGLDDPTDYVPQIALLSILSEGSPTNAVLIYDVDPDGSWVPQLAQTYVLPSGFQVSNECGANYAGSLLQAGDLQGRSVRVGEPEIIRVTQNSQPQIILGTPPMHVDYVKLDRDSSDPAEIVNFTVIPSSFRASFETEVTSSAQSSNESTTSYSNSVKKTDSSTFKVSFGKVGSVSETTKQVQEQTHDQSVSQTYDTYTSESFDASTSTGFGDQIWFTAQRFNIYAYPVIGQTACADDEPDCTEESPVYMLFSGPDEISRETINATAVEWYQPVHEPGQVLSYPWSLDQLEQRNGALEVLTSLTSFYTDDSDRTVQVTWSEQQGMDATSSSVDTYSQETDKSTSASATLQKTVGFGLSSTESVETGTSDSFETLNTTSTELGASTGIGVEKPDSFLEPNQYQYRVEPFVFGEPPPDGTEQMIDLDTDVQTTGVLQTAFVADPTDSLAGPWWVSSPYVQFPDVALNHPQRWSETTSHPESTADLAASCLPLSLSSTEATCLSINDPDPGDIWTSEFYRMRGLLVTVGGTAGAQRSAAEEGDDVFLQARVYNYSLAAMPPGTEVHVRFYRQEWDHTTNRAIDDSVLLDEQIVDPIPPFDLESNTTLPNWQTVSTSFDTTGLGDRYFVFWVVVWLENGAGNLVEELDGHGLESLPGTLTAVGDAPIEMVTITNLSGDEVTTSFSNNVGFLNSVFYVGPSGDAAATAGAVTSGTDPGSHRLSLESLEVSPARIALGDRAIVRAHVLSPGAHTDGVQVSFYDGDPENGGTLFDVEMLARVRSDDLHQVRVGFRPAECGTHTLFLVANPNRPTEALATTTLEVTCEDAPPDDGDDEDDGCQVTQPARPSGAWLLLAAASLLAVRRRLVNGGPQ